MVNEREPPKPAAFPLKDDGNLYNIRLPPEFGKQSPLGSTNLAKGNPFIIPKPNKPRPDHHRPLPQPTQSQQQIKDNEFRDINKSSATTNSGLGPTAVGAPLGPLTHFSP